MLSRPFFRYRPLFPAIVLSLGLALLAAPASIATDNQPGFLGGHLKIFSPQTVDLADGSIPPVTPETYLEYPLVVLDQASNREVRVFTANKDGGYRIALSPGRYVLDVQNRVRKHVRAKPHPFEIISGQTIHADMNMDTGIR
jgi:hypothetical protein